MMSDRTVVLLTFAHAASVVYLGLVGASVVFEVAAALFFDPGIGDAPVWYLVGGVVVSASVQSFALGAVLEALRGGSQGFTRPGRG
jgi:hypothetical protein